LNVTARQYLSKAAKEDGFKVQLTGDFDSEIQIGRKSGRSLSAFLGLLQQRGFRIINFTRVCVHIHAPLRNHISWDHGWEALICTVCDGTNEVAAGKKKSGAIDWQPCPHCTEGWLPVPEPTRRKEQCRL